MSLLGRLFGRRPAMPSEPHGTGVGGPFTGDIHVYQIVHGDAVISEDNPLFLPMDNRDGARPDWYEYWPIRRYLLDQTLDEDAVYGFLSPRFGEKTGLGGEQLFRHIETAPDSDVYLFSPFPCHGSFFRNVFEQGNFFDPGSFDLSAAFFRSVGRGSDLAKTVHSFDHVVFSNFFVAKPRFWRSWLELGEALFGAAEQGPLSDALCSTMMYLKENSAAATPVQRKVFLMERLASYLLGAEPHWRVSAYPRASLPISGSAAAFRDQIEPMDHLKRRHREDGDASALAEYCRRQREIVAACWPSGPLEALLP